MIAPKHDVSAVDGLAMAEKEGSKYEHFGAIIRVSVET